MEWKEISLKEFAPMTVGQAEDREGGTGLTVFLFGKDGAPAGVDIRGGGPASRETALLNPLMMAERIHAVVLSGGSAFGLDAAGGVQRYLEERGIGFDVGVTKVPLVCQSCIFDLPVGDSEDCVMRRPDAAMAYEACRKAEEGNYRDGNYGAGTGATVGKILGPAHAVKSGVGSFCVQVGDLKVGAVAVVNAVGDVYDQDTGKQAAGPRMEDGSFASTEEILCGQVSAPEPERAENTTIGIVFTNGTFDKTALCKIAGMAQDGMARAIRPVHTSMDGDSIYAVSLGEVPANRDTVGVLGARVMAKAILRAVTSAEPAYGLYGLNS